MPKNDKNLIAKMYLKGEEKDILLMTFYISIRSDNQILAAGQLVDFENNQIEEFIHWEYEDDNTPEEELE